MAQSWLYFPPALARSDVCSARAMPSVSGYVSSSRAVFRACHRLASRLAGAPRGAGSRRGYAALPLAQLVQRAGLLPAYPALSLCDSRVSPRKPRIDLSHFLSRKTPLGRAPSATDRSARSASPDCFRAVSVPIRSRAAATPPHPQPPPEGASEALDDVRRTRDSRAGERRARQSAKRNTGRQYTQHVDTCATSVQQEPTEYVGLRIQLQPQTTFHRAKRVTHGHHRLDPTSQHHLPHDRHKCGAASEPQQTAVPASVIK